MKTPFTRVRVEAQIGSSADLPKKKCLFLMTNSLETGGSERQFASVAHSLDRDAFDVELGCLQRKGTFLLEGLGEIAEFPVGGSFFSRRAQRARIDLARHLREKTAVVVHSFDFYSNMMLIPTARWSGVPVVIGSQRQIGDRLTRLQSAAQSAVFRMCDRVVCNSHAAAERLTGQGVGKTKLIVIPNGLCDNAFNRAPAAIPRAPGRVRIAYVARMNDLVKNHGGFLRAAARLAARFSSVEFLLVGDGPLRIGLEHAATDLGLAGRVRFLGERRDMSAVLASVDVSVLFSFSESMSNVMMEAMAAGLPVVASRVGGNSEVVQDGRTGLLVRTGDEVQLVEAMTKLVEQPQLRDQYGHRGRKVAEENFRMSRIVLLYQQLYTALLEEKGGHAWRSRSRWTRLRSRNHSTSQL